MSVDVRVKEEAIFDKISKVVKEAWNSNPYSRVVKIAQVFRDSFPLLPDGEKLQISLKIAKSVSIQEMEANEPEDYIEWLREEILSEHLGDLEDVA